MLQFNRLYLRAILTSTLLFVAVPVFAKRDGKHLEKMTKELNLTAAQKEKIKALPDDEQVKSLREAMHKAHEELQRAMKSDSTDEEIRAKYAQLEKAQAEFSKLRFEKVLAIRAILTPKQRLNFKGMDRDGEFKHHKRKRE